MEANIKYSPQQQSLIDFAETGTGNGLVSAVAGSGKTSTLFGVIQKAPANKLVAVCAFARPVADEFQDKFALIKDACRAKVFINTIHGFGLASIRRMFPRVKLALGRSTPNVLDGKTKIKYSLETLQVPGDVQSFVTKAYGLARQWGAGVLPEFPFNRAEAWLDLVDHFDLRDCFEDADGNVPENVDQLVKEGCQWAVRIIKAGIELVKTEQVIDFEDMVYIPLRMNLNVWQYDWVLVDECQDINPTKRAYVKKMLKVGGRAFFVGDARQAIFGFTGADAKSFENIHSEFACADFPLTWSFRCPKSVVNFVKQWVSHIESTPDAPEGIVRSLDASKLFDETLTVTDAILCRNNAPLVDLFFALLRKGIASHIEGKDIGAGLVRMIDRYPKLKTLAALETKLENYANRVEQKAQAAGREDKAQKVRDEVDCIIAVMHHLPQNSTVVDLRNKIYNMFQDDAGNKRPTLTLTSIHKSKGREWARVFWYGRNRWNPSPYARQDWQHVQEDNLCYVAGTRSKHELIDVTVPAMAR